MDRRGFLKTAALAATGAASGALAAPRLSLAADARTLRFVPQATHVRLSVSASNLKASHLEARAQLLRAFAETP